MKKYYLLTALIFSFFSVMAQFSISGKVIDAKSMQTLSHATVSTDISAVLTDEYGNFVLHTEKDLVTITISHLGYKPVTLTAFKNLPVKAELIPDAVSIKDVVIFAGNASSGFANLSRTDLRLNPVKNTQELMRTVPGLFIAQHAGGGKAEQIFLRGFDCDHGTDVAVSVDGLPVNMVSHAHGQGYADAHFIIPETISNIDFGTGPYYTQHGDLNTAGYVNFLTFNNIQNSRAQIEAGSFNSFRSLVMIDLFRKNKEKQSGYLANEFYYSDGPTANKQALQRYNIFAKYNLAISDKTQLIASVSFFKSRWDASGQIPTRAVENGMTDRFGSIDPSEGGNTERENINLLLLYRFTQNIKWENQLMYTRYLFNLYSNFTFFLNDPVNGDEINQAESRNMYVYSSKLTSKHYFRNASLTSTYGLGFRYDVTGSSKLSHVVNREFLSHTQFGSISELNVSGYIQQQLSTGKWLFDAGIRYDQFYFDYADGLQKSQPSQTAFTISPKMNLQYRVGPAFQLYVKTGKGFHSNDARVAVTNNGHNILPSAYGTDIGLIWKPWNNLLLNVAAWYLYLDQEFVYVGDDGNIEPSGRTKREGIDLIARYQFSRNLFANININLTKPRSIDEVKGRDYIPLAPVATSTGGIFYKAKEGFSGSISYRYIKDRPANEDNSITAKGYFITDASLSYTKKKYEIGVAFENLFNSKWNEAQFATTSRLKNEPAPVTELNFTPGNPFSAKLRLAVLF